MKKKKLENNTDKKADDQGNVTLGVNAQSVLDISTNFQNPAQNALKNLQLNYKKQNLSPIKSMDSEQLNDIMAKQDQTQFREEQSVVSAEESIVDFSINKNKESVTLKSDIIEAEKSDPNIDLDLGMLLKGKVDTMQKALKEKIQDAVQKEIAKNMIKNHRKRGLKQVLEERQIKKPKSLLTIEPVQYVSRASYVPDQSDTESEGDGKNLDPETGIIEYKDTQGNITKLKPNQKFIRFKEFFKNMLMSYPIITQYEVITMTMANDSSCVLAVTKRNDFMSYIVIYCLKTHELLFEEKIEGDCIKAKEIEQNADGSLFAIMYFDDGKFRLRFFTKQSRSEELADLNTVKFNEMLNINNYTMPNNDFPDPYCNCTFISDKQIFVNLFHSYSQTHYHFIWDRHKKSIIGIDGSSEPISKQIDCLPTNFPYKSFYSDENKELYCFYRDGHAVSIKANNLGDYRVEKMTDRECGQMVLVYDQALVVRSSAKILFFKQEFNLIKEVKEWKLYHEMNTRGMIYFIKGNIRIQITTAEYIYFYLIDKETFMPDLENAMQNFMECNQLMVGKRVRNAISYKTNERCFIVYQRKSMHNLRVCVNGDNFENCKVLELETSNTFLVSQIDKIYMMDSDTFKVCGEIPVELLPTQTREPNEIVGMVKSEDENYLAIISGKNLVMNEQKQNQLFIFKRKPAITDFDYDNYEQYKRIVIKDIPIFKKVVMQFYFKLTKRGKPPDSLVFARSDMIFELDFESHTVTKVYQMQQICNLQPQFFLMDIYQEIAVIASDSDGIWIDRESCQFIDLDLLFNISRIKCVIYDDEDENFYLLCNKKGDTLGFFLIKFSKSNPKDFLFVTMVRHNLDIDNVNMFISRGKSDGKTFKELIIGYKMIYINTYTVQSIDISDIETSKEGVILHKHESFQLWEAEVCGHLLKHQLDYMSLSKQGINILALGPNPKHDIQDFEGKWKTIHSLDCLNWLKCSQENLITYQCQYYDDRVISVDQEYCKGTFNDDISHYYYNVYKIKIHEITLREILVIQSMYLANSVYDVQTLVKMQPKPQFFYKSFLELDCANLVYTLSFDSVCIRSILDDKYEEFFPPPDYPLIYMNKFMKKNGKGFFMQNSIDLALISNQISAVNKLIEYIVKYQNNYVSSYLFQKNIVGLLERGITCQQLTDSNIFCMKFDYDGWPSVHNDHTECFRPYCGSFADIRDSYKIVFPESRFEPKVRGEIEEEEEGEQGLGDLVPFGQAQEEEDVSDQFVSIKYTVNLLAQASFHIQPREDEENPTENVNEDVSLMKILSTTEEIDLLTSKAVKQVIQFKWREFGRKHHMLGFIMQVFYIMIFMQYIMGVYIRNPKQPKGYLILLIIGIAFPITYDVVQISRIGLKIYLESPWNKCDFASYICNFLNFLMQSSWGHDNGFSKLLMCLIVLFQIAKCFFFLRLFNSLTPIIVMLKNVVYDLRIFLMFYGILIFMMGQCYAIIGLGNNYEKVEDTYINHHGVNTTYMRRINPAAGTEHFAIGLHFAEILWTLRFSMGDNTGIGIAKKTPNSVYHQEPFKLEGADNLIFWVLWLITVLVTCIIFLNFIVAEASASYCKVTEILHQVINQEMASLIAEAEIMSPKQFLTTKNYPQFIISREVDY